MSSVLDETSIRTSRPGLTQTVPGHWCGHWEGTAAEGRPTRRRDDERGHVTSIASLGIRIPYRTQNSQRRC